MKPWERYAQPQAGPWQRYAAQPEPEKSIMDSAGEVVRDLAAGAVRGAGSIGATILAPIDAAARAVGIENDIIGRSDRRQAMTEALGAMGADTESAAFAVGKVGAEVAGTSGVGGVLANTAARVAPGAAAAFPGVIESLRTAGMSAGMPGAMGARVLGGAATGAAAAGLVNPGEAGQGAAIGAALPVALSAAAQTGKALAKVIRAPMQSDEVRAAVQIAKSQGLVVPPTQANPTLANRLIEGTAGKLTTAQNASAKNAKVFQRMSAKALGLPGNTPLSPEVLQAVRKTAGQAYQAVESTGQVIPDAAYSKALDDIAAPFLKAAQGFPGAKPSPVIDLVDSMRSSAFDAGSAVSMLRQLRTAADDAFRTGNTDIGRASRAAAGALEDVLERHIQGIGQPQLLSNFREARKLIAKTHTVESAMNAGTGSIDARKFARALAKGKPLEGELLDMARFASAFPKAAQTVEQMGSLPGMSPLDVAGAGVMASMTNPAAMAAVGLRPAARAIALSPFVQSKLLQQQGGMAGQMAMGRLAPLTYRAAPVIPSSDR